MERQSRGALAVLLAATLWGFWPVWVRGAAGGPATALIAQLVGGLVVLPLALGAGAARRRAGGRVPLAALLGVVALAAVNAANMWLYFRALESGRVAPAVLGHYLAPLLVALSAPLVLGEARSPGTPWALALGLLGTLAVLAGPAGLALDGAAGRAFLLGAGSAVFYAGSTLVAKRLAPVLDGTELLAYQSLVAVVLLLPLVPLPPLGADWARPALGGVLACAVPGLLYYFGLRRLPAERLGILATWEVAAAALVGWAVYAEAPGWGALLGGLLILSGGILVMRGASS